jgi:hypothetical protein
VDAPERAKGRIAILEVILAAAERRCEVPGDQCEDIGAMVGSVATSMSDTTPAALLGASGQTEKADSSTRTTGNQPARRADDAHPSLLRH